jgi:hypothetical protein
VAKHQVIGWVVGVALFLLLQQLLPEVRCADGWASPSIGRQGACSHHGGVRDNGIYVILILGLSIAAGIITASKLKPTDLTVPSQPTSLRTSRPTKPGGPQNLRPAAQCTFYTARNAQNQSKEAELISSAIKDQRKIEFTYKKPTANKPELRTILPHEFKHVAHKHGPDSTHCVVGFCDKRKEQRTFALKRMSNIRVL